MSSRLIPQTLGVCTAFGRKLRSDDLGSSWKRSLDGILSCRFTLWCGSSPLGSFAPSQQRSRSTTGMPTTTSLDSLFSGAWEYQRRSISPPDTLRAASHFGGTGWDGSLAGMREGCGRPRRNCRLIRRTAGEPHAYVLEDLTEVPTAQGNLVAVVVAGPSGEARRHVGGVLGEDPHQAVAKAILDAINRPLALALAQHGLG